MASRRSGSVLLPGVGRALTPALAALAVAAGTAASAAGGAEAAGPPPAADAGFILREVEVAGSPRRFAVHVPPDYDPARPWPCVVFLHGSGECGDDGEKQTRVGLLPAVLARPERWPCFVVLPQKPRQDEEWEEHEAPLLAALAAVEREFRIDADRVALTGLSQGGHGVWTIGARNPHRFSCLAPVCGYGRPRTIAPRVAHLPVWAFHGLKDDVVDPEESRRIVAAIQKERQQRGLDPAGVRLTLYPDANHNSWDPAYGEPELPGWLLGHKRTAPEAQR